MIKLNKKHNSFNFSQIDYYQKIIINSISKCQIHIFLLIKLILHKKY